MSRGYASQLRADQQEQTRQRIFEAVREELEQQQPDELSFASIAERAKIAERTVYRHFPTKEALLEAFWAWWIPGPFGVPIDEPMAPDEFPTFIAKVYAAFDRVEPVSRALIVSREGRTMRDRSRRGRIKMIDHTFESVMRGLDPQDRKLALSVFQLLLSINTWQTLRDFRKLNGPEAAKAATWAARVLLAELRRNPKTFEETP